MSTVSVRDATGQFAGPNPGRPRKFQDIETFTEATESYFAECDAKGKTPHLAGVARALECSRQTLINYKQYDDAEPFVDAIENAKRRCDEALMDLALRPKNGVHPAIPIFLSKNNHGYRDLQEVHVDTRTVVMGVTVSLEQHRKELEAIDAQIVEIAKVNAIPPALETAVIEQAIDPTFASNASLSPVPCNTYPVDNSAK